MKKRNRRSFLIGTGTCATGLVVGSNGGGEALAFQPPPRPRIDYIMVTSAGGILTRYDPDTAAAIAISSGAVLTIHGANFGNGSVPADTAKAILMGSTCSSTQYIRRVDIPVDLVGMPTGDTITVRVGTIGLRTPSRTLRCCPSTPPVPSKDPAAAAVFFSGDSSITITTVTPAGNFADHQVFAAIYS